jgi:hypothetical protein
MSEERDIKPDFSAGGAAPTQYDPATPVKPKTDKIMLVVSSPDGQRMSQAIMRAETRRTRLPGRS